MILSSPSVSEKFRCPIGLLALTSLLVFSLLPHSQAAATKPKVQPQAASKPAPAKTKNGMSRDPYLGAIAIDAATGRVLVEDQPDAKGCPASVLKLMDLLIVLERIEQRQLSFQDPVTVSAKAAKTGGSQVWLADKEVFTVDEILYALMVQSANDAAVAIAEKASGSTEAHVEVMNARAKQLGMVNTVFHSVHGLPPGAGQQADVTTPRDLALLCRELLKRPDTLRYTSTREWPFRPDAGEKTIIMRTHNHLMAQVEGCDGLKTGYYSQAGFSIAATAARRNQRVIAIVLGSSDRKVRDAKAANLIAKAFLVLQTPPPASASAPGSVKPVVAARPPTQKPR